MEALRTTLARSIVISTLVGCATSPSGASTAATTPTTTTLPGATQSASVVWSDVEASDGCFFFAGPGELGRDDSHGDVAEVAVRDGSMFVAFSEATMFEGGIGQGSFRLTRSAMYDFNGPWRAKETLEGRSVDDVYLGTYAYEECDLSSDESCPGPCTIRATVRIIPRP